MPRGLRPSEHSGAESRAAAGRMITAGKIFSGTFSFLPVIIIPVPCYCLSTGLHDSFRFLLSIAPVPPLVFGFFNSGRRIGEMAYNVNRTDASLVTASNPSARRTFYSAEGSRFGFLVTIVLVIMAGWAVFSAMPGRRASKSPPNGYTAESGPVTEKR